MQSALRRYGKIVPFVCGKRGEMNKEAFAFVCRCAKLRADDEYEELGFAKPDGALPFFRKEIVHDWGCANVKEHARCLSSLFEHVGDGPLVSKKQQRRDELIFAVRASVESSFSPPSQSCCPTPGRG